MHCHVHGEVLYDHVLFTEFIYICYASFVKFLAHLFQKGNLFSILSNTVLVSI